MISSIAEETEFLYRYTAFCHAQKENRIVISLKKIEDIAPHVSINKMRIISFFLNINSMKKLSNLNGAQVLSKKEQRGIKGGRMQCMEDGICTSYGRHCAEFVCHILLW